MMIVGALFCWARATLRHWRWDGNGFSAKVFGDEIAVLAKPVARPFDLDDHGMVEKPVQQRGGDDGIAEDFAPLGESAVGGEDHRALFIAAVDELEEQIATARRDRQVSDLVDDEQCWAT